ncbi:MAG: MmgE/PrpD family protein [Syntrophorhabdus sp. PtaU1.Bin058]|nr:MAG: MmgE/PrpD family protein [Syntrophorhabdus sp. PtaU1.Bin058]
MNRRRFLKASAIMGTAVTVGDTVFSSIKNKVFAKEPETKDSKAQGAAAMQKLTGETMEKVSSYIAGSQKTDLPENVVKKAKHHIMDTLAAVVSGSALRPGQFAAEFVKTQGGVEEALVAGTKTITSAINAALANGMMAHSDETDDSHEKSLTHPGAAVVPAAMAISDRAGADGRTFLKGVVAGYDIGCRITQALGVDQLDTHSHSTHALGEVFGAATAAASILQLSQGKAKIVLSYTGQQASGVTYWQRDPEHIEKAFVFGGMPARNGVTSALFVQAGFTGVSDIFSGQNNFLTAFSPDPDPKQLFDGLGNRYEVVQTNIKRFSVGSPIQAPLDAVLLLREKYHLKPQDVARIVVHVPPGARAGGRVVDSREMPDVNIQYILAVALLDGTLTFEAAHSYKRMSDPAVVPLRKLVSVVLDPTLDTSITTRQAAVYLTTTKGETLKEHVLHVRGTTANPMTDAEVEKKCRDLFEPVLGRERTSKVVEMIWNIEKVRNMREFWPLLRS